MTTYLDHYVHQFMKHSCQTVEFDPANPEEFKTLTVRPDNADGDPATWLREQVHAAVVALKSKPSWLNGVREEIVCFRWMLAPFVYESMKRPMAASLDRELVEDMRGQNADARIRNVGIEAVDEYGVSYLDLPHRAYRIGTTLQLRALFATKMLGRVRFTAVLTAPGANSGRRVSWWEGCWAKGLPGLGDDNLTWSMEGDCSDRTDEDLAPYLAAIDNRDAVFSDIEHFAWLALTYVHTEQENGMEWQRLPHIRQGDPRWSGRKARQVAKKYSLFSIIEVNARNLYRNSDDEGLGGSLAGHKKRKHRVRGHFRLQAYGPRWSKRRLKWYRSHYSGTIDLPVPIPLYKHRAVDPEGLAA